MKDYPIKFYLKGSASIEEIQFLQKLASKSSNDILEIGGFQGRTAIAMAEEIDDTQHVYTIDTWSNARVEDDVFLDKGVFLNNILIAGVSHTITALHGSASKFKNSWTNKIGLLFIDGQHTYEAVTDDFESFYAHVADSGIIAFHDYTDPRYTRTVVRAVNQLAKQYPINKIDCVGSLIAFTKS